MPSILLLFNSTKFNTKHRRDNLQRRVSDKSCAAESDSASGVEQVEIALEIQKGLAVRRRAYSFLEEDARDK